MKAPVAQTAFRYRPQDSATDMTLITTKFLPQYEADEGALTKAQLKQIKKSAPKAKGGTLHPSMVRMAATAFAAASK